MKPNIKNGFTLIEVLISISIIGILSSVLVPNLFNARTQAQERAAQGYSSNITMVLTAVLTGDAQLQPSTVAGGTFNCGIGAAATETIEVDGKTFNYGWAAAPSNVTGCAVTGDDVAGIIAVEITTDLGTYINGIKQ